MCLFWIDVKVSNEPHQVAAAQAPPPPQPDGGQVRDAERRFRIFRNGSWAPAQAAKGKLFDKPFYNPNQVSDAGRSRRSTR